MMCIKVCVELCDSRCAVFAEVADTACKCPYSAAFRVATWGTSNLFSFHAVFLLGKCQRREGDQLERIERYGFACVLGCMYSEGDVSESERVFRRRVKVFTWPEQEKERNPNKIGYCAFALCTG